MSLNWNQVFNRMGSNPKERDIEIEFIIPLIEEMGYDRSEYCCQFKTGLDQKTVDFAVRKNTSHNDQFKNSKLNPFLLIEAKKPSEDITKHRWQLIEYLKQPNCLTAQFGIMTNSKEIQLYRKHGKVVHPLTKPLPLRDGKADETLAKIKDLIRNPKKALTICVYNNKGGVGKTTTAVNLAATLGFVGYKVKDFIFKNNSRQDVLAIDFDSQRDLTKSLFRDPMIKKSRGLHFSYEDYNMLSKEKITLTQCLENTVSLREAIYEYKFKFKNKNKVLEASTFYVIPSDNGFEKYLTGEKDIIPSFVKLRELLAELNREYDYIVIDCPTQWSFFSKSALYASDVLLIPAKHSDLSSLHNAAKVITEIIPQINELREDDLTALPIFYNDEEKDIQTDKFSGNEKKMFKEELYFIYKTYGPIYDGKPDDFEKYFEKGEVILKSAAISSDSFSRLPAVYRNSRVLNNYADLVKHYFIEPAKQPEKIAETVSPEKEQRKPPSAKTTKIVKLDANTVKKIRTKLCSYGRIDRKEAEYLFKLNKEFSEENNDPSWKTLFIEALTDHFLKNDVSPGEVDEDEAAYIIGKIKADGIDDTESELLVNIAANAKSCHESFTAFIIEVLRSYVLADGVVDDDETEMIRKVIYSAGIGDGTDIDQADADFLFDLNDSTSGADNSPAWKKLFVEAVSKYLLEDEKMPGKIDEQKAEWLIGRLGSDGELNDNEKALLTQIKSSAKEIHPKLLFKLGFLMI